MSNVFAQEKNWITYYEKSNFLETPRYTETIEYCKQLANESSYLQYTSFGKSAQGRDLPLLILDKKGEFDIKSIKESGNTILLIEACIHPGESEGKDATLMLLRDLLIDEKDQELLNHTTILFIPIFNTDGHERFSKYGRINQNGPAEMGWRTTAQNYDLNRDFIKANAVEMQHWLRLFNKWLPDMMIDIHTTDGADYQYGLTYGMHTQGDMHESQTVWQKDYLNNIEALLQKDDILMFPYVSFRRWHDPRSGLIRRTASPRFSTGYLSIQNRPALLVETHMLKNYKTRVDITYQLLKRTLEFLNADHQNLQKANKEADLQASGLAGKFFTMDYSVSKKDSSMVMFKGVEYDIVHSDLSDDIWVQFGDKPKTYDIVLFDKIVEGTVVKLPEAYIVPVEYSDIIDKLRLHGIQFKTLDKDQSLKVETYKFSDVSFQTNPYEGQSMLKSFNMEDIEIQKEYMKGSVIVPVNQRAAKVIAHILEPKGPDSYLRWGMFNAIFERKEYVETYVMEKMAREMIKEKPELKEQYFKAIKAHPEKYHDHWTKLYWFYEKTPFYDQHKDIYPIGKIEKIDALGAN